MANFVFYVIIVCHYLSIAKCLRGRKKLAISIEYRCIISEIMQLRRINIGPFFPYLPIVA